MKLDESIELINKKKNINEMNKLTNLPVSEMRNCMHEMMTDENASGCLYEVLTQEGFLPETLAEGEDYGTHCSTMMEDDMIAEEMFKACASNMSECGSGMQNYLNEKYMEEAEGINPAIYDQLKYCIEHGHSYEQSKQHVAKVVDGWNLSMEDYMEAKKEFGKEHRDGVELEEGGEEGGSRYMFFSNLELIKHHVEAMLAMDASKIESILENGHDWAEDHISTAKESIDQVFDFLTGEAEEGAGEVEMPGAEAQPAIAVIGAEEEPMMENEDDEDEDDEDSPTYLLKQKKILDEKIAKYSRYVARFVPMIAKLDPSTLSKEYSRELQGAEYSNEGFMDFLTKKEDESGIEYYNRLTRLGTGYPDIFSGLVEPRKRSYFNTYGSQLDPETLDVMEDLLSDIFDIKNSVYTTMNKIGSIETGIEDRNANKELDATFDDDDETTFVKTKADRSFDDTPVDWKVGDDLDDDDFEDYDEKPLKEDKLPDYKPVVGKNVQSTNKSDATEATKEELADAEDSQETTEEKVDNLKNQKFSPNMETKAHVETKDLALGYKNALNYDYSTEPSQDYKDRVEMEVKNGHSRKRDESKVGEEANIDKDSKTGEKIWNASKENQTNADYDWAPNPIVTTDQGYQKTSVSGKVKSSGEKNNKINEDIERMKKMFGYEAKLIEENKTPKELNENEILFKQVSGKKFI